MSTGHVFHHKFNTDVNVGKANANPILDKRVYEVDFNSIKVIKLATNVMAECMYMQCDTDGFKYLLLYSFIDYIKFNKTVTISIKKIVVNGKPLIRKSTTG